jgi:hypothetical protein
MAHAVVEEDIFGVALVEADEYPAATPSLGVEQRSHRSIRLVRRYEHPDCRRSLKGAAQQKPPQTSSAKGRPDKEQVDEVAAVEVTRPYRHQAGDRVTLDSDDARTAFHESLDLLGPSESCGVERDDVVDIVNASSAKICHVDIIDQPSVQARAVVACPINSAPGRSTHPPRQRKVGLLPMECSPWTMGTGTPDCGQARTGSYRAARLGPILCG